MSCSETTCNLKSEEISRSENFMNFSIPNKENLLPNVL